MVSPSPSPAPPAPRGDRRIVAVVLVLVAAVAGGLLLLFERRSPEAVRAAPLGAYEGPSGSQARGPKPEAPSLVAPPPNAALPTDGGNPPVDAGLPRTRGVRGFIRDSGSRGIAGAEIHFRSFVKGRRHELATARSRYDGRYEQLGLQVGQPVLLFVRAEGFSPRHGRLPSDGQQTEEIDFVLERGETLRGRVVDEKARPVEAAHVELAPKATAHVGYIKRTTDANGRFEFSEAPSRRECFWVKKATFQDEVHCGRFTAGEDIVITLRKAGRVEGRVVRSGTGEPLRHFWVGRAKKGGGQTTMVDHPLGEFRIENLAAGTYAFSARAEGRLYARIEGVAVRAGETTRLTLELAGGRQLSGSVRSAADDSPIEGASVRLHPCGHDPMLAKKLRSDRLGLFEIDDVTECAHVLEVEHPRFRPLRRAQLTVEHTRGLRAELKLEPR